MSGVGNSEDKKMLSEGTMTGPTVMGNDNGGTQADVEGNNVHDVGDDASGERAALGGGLKEEGSEEDHRCGWGGWKPSCVQACNSAKGVLVFLCVLAITQGMVVNGFVNVVITSLERRFNLPSVNTGLIASSYDISIVVLLVFVTYYGGQGNKPRFLGVGAFIMGLGSFVFMLPHFTTGTYKFESDMIDVCNENRTLEECKEEESGLSTYLGVFILGQLLHGVGAAPLYTLGVTYLDENVSVKMASVYIGVFYSTSLIGPAVGYLLGGQFLNIYTDIGQVDTNSLGITVDSPLWVGAWWIGFILAGVLAWSTCIPLLGYPKQLPGSDKIQREVETHKGGDDRASKPGFGTTLKDMPTAFAVLMCNAPFMFLNLAGASEAFITTGFSTFGPKFVESQFSQTSSWAATLVGLVVVPGGFLGTLGGGILVKKFDLKVRGIIKYCLVTVFISFLSCACVLVTCSNPSFAGITEPYSNKTLEGTNITSGCNANCHCLSMYDPVCGADDMMYYSACHAGCTHRVDNGGTTGYSHCSCIPETDEIFANSTTAVAGKCASNCGAFEPVFLAVFFIAIMFTFLAGVPALTATLRCVPFSQRSFALGLQWIVIRVLGSIPGPITFGAVIDRTCLLWDENCGEMGTCWQYNNPQMSLYLLFVSAGFKLLSLLFFALALLTYKAPKGGEEEDDTGRELTNVDSYGAVDEKQIEMKHE